jgi:hypothetical protein
VRSICGRSGEGAVVCYRFGEEKGAEEEEEGLDSVISVRTRLLLLWSLGNIYVDQEIILGAFDGLEIYLSFPSVQSTRCQR